MNIQNLKTTVIGEERNIQQVEGTAATMIYTLEI